MVSIRGKTETLPLHIEVLFNDYNTTGAFAAASILPLLALVTLVLKGLCERAFDRVGTVQTYGDYLPAKVGKVFPDLMAATGADALWVSTAPQGDLGPQPEADARDLGFDPSRVILQPSDLGARPWRGALDCRQAHTPPKNRFGRPRAD